MKHNDWYGAISYDHIGFVNPTRNRWIDAAGRQVVLEREHDLYMVIPQGAINPYVLAFMAAFNNVFHVFNYDIEDHELGGNPVKVYVRRMTNIHSMTVQVSQLRIPSPQGIPYTDILAFTTDTDVSNTVTLEGGLSRWIRSVFDYIIQRDLNHVAFEIQQRIKRSIYAEDRKDDSKFFGNDWSSWMENRNGVNQNIVGLATLYAQMAHNIVIPDLDLCQRMFFEVGTFSPGYLNLFGQTASIWAGYIGRMMGNWTCWEVVEEA